MKLTSADRIKFLNARVKRILSGNKVSKQFPWPVENNIWWTVMEDNMKAQNENMECDRDMEERIEI